MEKHSIDVLIATTPGNFNYAVDPPSPLYYTAAFAILPKDGQLTIVQSVAHLWPRPLAKNTIFYGVNPTTIWTFPQSENEIIKRIRQLEPEKDALSALIKALKREDFEDKVIGIDEAGLLQVDFDVSWVWRKIKEELPKAEMLRASSIWNEVRMVKTNEEIERLKKVAEISQSAAKTAIEKISEGTGEMDIARETEIAAIKQGAMPVINVISFGPNSAYADHPLTVYEIKVGDIAKINLAHKYKHYWSDISINTVLGPPTERQKHIFASTARCQEKIIDSAKPGMKASDLVSIATDFFKCEGIAPRANIGHGVGVECVEPPYLNSGVESPLEQNMVLSIESRYYEPEYGGILMEEPILITKNGCRRLTTISEDNKLRA